MKAGRYVEVTCSRRVLLRSISESKVVSGRGLQSNDHRIGAWIRVCPDDRAAQTAIVSRCGTGASRRRVVRPIDVECC